MTRSQDSYAGSAAIGALTGFPTCDEMASRLAVPLYQLDRLLLDLLGGVVNLA